jgi:hypothetical protein
MHPKCKYRELCGTNVGTPLFSQDWWLDAAAGESNWDVCAVQPSGEIVASLPYYRTRKLLLDVIRMPHLTPSMSVWIRYPERRKYATRLAYEKEILSELIAGPPRLHYFYQHFHWSFANWLPFYWAGFRQSTRYTYVLECLEDPGALFAGFRENVRREIRKAEKQLRAVKDDDIEKLYDICKKSFERQNKKMPYTLALVKSIDEACRRRGCRKMWFAVDEKERIHSAVYIVWDRAAGIRRCGRAAPAPCCCGKRSGSHCRWRNASISRGACSSRSNGFSAGSAPCRSRISKSRKWTANG